MPLHLSCFWNDPDLLHCEWLHSPIYGTEAKMPSEFLVEVLSSDHRPPNSVYIPNSRKAGLPACRLNSPSSLPCDLTSTTSRRT